MSTLQVIPEALQAAAGDLANIGASLEEANNAAAPLTTVAPAAADEVSAAMAGLFNGHAQWWQGISAQAAQLHQQFVQTMRGAADTYLANEAANISLLQQNALAVINAPTDALLGRPLIGHGTDGYTNAQGVGTNGGPGGLLWGSGGNGGNSTAPGVTGGNGGAAGLFGRGGSGGNGGSIPGGTAQGGAGGNGGTTYAGQLGTGNPLDPIGGAGGIGGSGGILWGKGGTGGHGGAGIASGGTGGAEGFDSFLGAALSFSGATLLGFVPGL